MLKATGNFLLGCTVFAAIIAVPIAFFLGVGWLSDKLTTFFLPACVWVALACVVLLPFAIFNATRPFAAFGFLFASFFFGLTSWLMGFAATLSLWGAVAVAIGLFFIGFGVVPMGIAALALKGFWGPAGLLTFGLVLTYGTRAFAFWLGDLVDQQPHSAAPAAWQ